MLNLQFKQAYRLAIRSTLLAPRVNQEFIPCRSQSGGHLMVDNLPPLV
jgi:hypothetical protein